MAAKGLAAPEPGKAFARARQFCEHQARHHFGRSRALQLAPGLHSTPLFVTITDGKLMSRVACRRPALAQSPPRICLRVDFFAIRDHPK
jgi:hypothetical protein